MDCHTMITEKPDFCNQQECPTCPYYELGTIKRENKYGDIYYISSDLLKFLKTHEQQILDSYHSPYS